MHPFPDLAARLLRLEQQLRSYQRLHSDELAELWRGLNECKRELAAAVTDERADNSFPVRPANEGRVAQEEEYREI